ncbi:hypothetical protein Bbelb_174410 [Branchiostoma belcheri]|nr:hypothetical protein Bbelb_174410 [Branchiostoma belcheri]
MPPRPVTRMQACNTYQPSCGKTCSRRTCLENMLNWPDIHTGSSQHLALSNRQRAGFADRPNSVITCISVEECWVSCVCSRKVISHGLSTAAVLHASAGTIFATAEENLEFSDWFYREILVVQYRPILARSDTFSLTPVSYLGSRGSSTSSLVTVAPDA